MEKIQQMLEVVLERLPYFDSQAVLIALIAGWITGAIWYMLTDSAYQSATRNFDGERRAPRTQIRAGIAQAIMTIMLAMIIHKLGAHTLQAGAYIAIMMWFGFVMTTMVVNHSHLGAPMTLTLVDGIHWFLVLVVMGAIIGTMTPSKDDQAAAGTTEQTPALSAPVQPATDNTNDTDSADRPVSPVTDITDN